MLKEGFKRTNVSSSLPSRGGEEHTFLNQLDSLFLKIMTAQASTIDTPRAVRTGARTCLPVLDDAAVESVGRASVCWGRLRRIGSRRVRRLTGEGAKT